MLSPSQGPPSHPAGGDAVGMCQEQQSWVEYRNLVGGLGLMGDESPDVQASSVHGTMSCWRGRPLQKVALVKWFAEPLPTA